MPLNAAQIYQNNKINTASPAELTLMLYEGAIKFCNLGLAAIESGDVLKANKNIKKAERIIDTLVSTLDHKYPVAAEFEKVYKVISENLLWANIRKDKERLERALADIRDMRDIWKEVMKNARTA